MAHPRLLLPVAAALALIAAAPAVHAADSPPPDPITLVPGPFAYADLVDLGESAPLVVRAQVRKVAALDGAHPGTMPGRVRVYIEAQTEALLAGRGAVGETLRYLADVPADARGKPLSLKKRRVLLFARPVPGRPGELQLVAPDGQLLWDAPVEARVRGVLAELLSANAPAKIALVREALYVPGNLAGEGETQMSLLTQAGAPIAVTVIHRPGAATRWGISLGEIIDEAAMPPQPDTLLWYLLACTLPTQLPAGANLSTTAADRAMAEADYRFVRGALGACGRLRAAPLAR